MSRRAPLRLVHTADVHLGAGFATPNDAGHDPDRCVCPLEGVLERLTAEAGDVLLITGDLFDHRAVPDELIERALALLGEVDVPVVVLPGNHDLFHAESLYLRNDEAVARSGIRLVTDLAGELFSTPDGAVTFWGRAMEEHSPQFEPLADLPDRVDDGTWYVALAHGHFSGDGVTHPIEHHRSSPITCEQLAAARADYLAMGHWHITTDVSQGSTPAWYSGSPMSAWAAGGVLIVDLVEGADAAVRWSEIPHPDGCTMSAVEAPTG